MPEETTRKFVRPPDWRDKPAFPLPPRPPREPLTDEEVAGLSKFVTETTAKAVDSAEVAKQREYLFQVGAVMRRRAPDRRQTAEILSPMVGMQIKLAHGIYRIQQYIDRGTFGAVFRVQEQPSGRTGILKLSLPFDRRKMFVSPTATAKEISDAERIRTTIKEAFALDVLSKDKDGKRLTRKGGMPPVPILYDAQFMTDPLNRDSRIAAFVMEEITGPFLTPGTETDPKKIKNLVKQLVSGLMYIRSRGVNHGDINLNNVRQLTTGQPIYLDFGSASVVGAVEQRRNRLSPERTAPASSGRVVYHDNEHHIFAAADYVPEDASLSDDRDEYALGVLVWKLIYGEQFRRLEDRALMYPKLDPTLQAISDIAESMQILEVEQRPSLNKVLSRLR